MYSGIFRKSVIHVPRPLTVVMSQFIAALYFEKIKVGKMLQPPYVCLLSIHILAYWTFVPISIHVWLYFGAKTATFCTEHIESRKLLFEHCSAPPTRCTNKSFCMWIHGICHHKIHIIFEWRASISSGWGGGNIAQSKM